MPEPTLELRIAGPFDAQAWDDFVATSSDACSYHRWEWGALLSEEFRLRRHDLMAVSDGRVRGILPFIVQADVFGRRSLRSLPYVNYAGPVASDEAAMRAILDGAAQAVAVERATFAELRCLPGTRLSLPVSERKVRPVLALPPKIDDLWNSFPTKLRTKIRRPMKEDLTVQVGATELVDEFYRILCVKWRELGSPIYRKSFFLKILETFPGEHTILLLRDAGHEAVGACWLHGYGDSVEAIWSGTLVEWDRVKGNMLLYWRAMEWAVDRGFRQFDFGRSTEGGGTHAFKMQWGAVSSPLPWFYVAGSATVPPPAADQSRAATTIQSVWKRLPLPMTRILGPVLARRIPL